MRASIDIGSNSILLLGGTFEDQKFIEKINKAEVAGLGKGIDDNGCFDQERMDLAFNILNEYKKILSTYNIQPKNVIVTATEASRVASNSKFFFDKIKNELGFEIKIISTEGEAFYTAYGVSLDDTIGKSFTIMDLGGASTEFIKVSTDPFVLGKSISLPVGSVRATDWISVEKFSENFSKILSDNRAKIEGFKSETLICVAGTMTTMAAVILNLKKYRDDLVQGMAIDISTFEKKLKELESLNTDGISKKYPIAGKRAVSLYGGAKVAFELGKYLENSVFKISTYGLRYGTLAMGYLNKKYILP